MRYKNLINTRVAIDFVGDKAIGWISKRCLQENKAQQIFQKTNIFYPDM